VLQEPDLDEALPQFLPQLARLLCPAGYRDLITRILAQVPMKVLLFEDNALMAEAVLTESAGDHTTAKDLYDQATAAWAAYGYLLEEAHALLGVGRCSLTLGLPGRTLVLQAREILTRLGAAPLLAESAVLLEECE
jgi:hypothetical protein